MCCLSLIPGEQQRLEAGTKRRRVACLTLPNDDWIPASYLEAVADVLIALCIAREFGQPILNATLGLPRETTTRMLMPKTPMD